MITIGTDKYLTIKDYAKNQGVSIQTVYNWIKDKKIKTKSLIGKQLIKL